MVTESQDELTNFFLSTTVKVHASPYLEAFRSKDASKDEEAYLEEEEPLAHSSDNKLINAMDGYVPN